MATDVQVRRSRPPSPRSNGKQTRSKPRSDTKKCPPGGAATGNRSTPYGSGCAGYAICTASRRGLRIAPAAATFSRATGWMATCCPQMDADRTAGSWLSLCLIGAHPGPSAAGRQHIRSRRVRAGQPRGHCPPARAFSSACLTGHSFPGEPLMAGVRHGGSGYWADPGARPGGSGCCALP